MTHPPAQIRRIDPGPFGSRAGRHAAFAVLCTASGATLVLVMDNPVGNTVSMATAYGSLLFLTLALTLGPLVLTFLTLVSVVVISQVTAFRAMRRGQRTQSTCVEQPSGLRTME